MRPMLIDPLNTVSSPNNQEKGNSFLHFWSAAFLSLTFDFNAFLNVEFSVAHSELNCLYTRGKTDFDKLFKLRAQIGQKSIFANQ